jgi:histidinol-phosphate aminotransferase
LRDGSDSKETKRKCKKLNENLFIDSELFIADSCQYSKTEQRDNELHLYPPGGNRIIREAAAEVFGFSVDEVFPAAGASHALSLLLLRFASIYRKIILPSPTWGYYRSCAKALDITTVDVKMKVEDKQFVYDIAALDSALASNGPAILLLSTPNNPTGNIIDYQDIGKLASSNPTSMVIVDESYFGFVDIDPCAVSKLAHAHDNIIIIRSLSKAYGLAGLRVGFALATGFAKNAINNFFLPFGLPIYVQEIAAYRLKDNSLLQKVRIACAAGYDALVSGLAENSAITAYRSNANYCFINVPPGTAKNYLKQLEINGYLVKYYSDSYIRITIAKPQIMIDVASILNKGIEK